MKEASVAYLPAKDDGCAFYRLWMPHLRTPNSRYISKTPVPYSALAGCNMVVVQRLATQDNYEALKKFKEVGLGIIYDLDDDMWAIQASNPAAAEMKRVKHDIVGFEACIKMCDVVTCSTSHLESSIKTNTMKVTPIRVVNNAVEMSLFRPSILPRDDNRVIIGWGGSSTHKEDLAVMKEAMAEVHDQEEKAFLYFVGMVPNIRIVGRKRLLAHGWVPVKEFPVRLASWNWDIALAPLEDNRFNRSKSNIKMCEAGAMKIPCLASDVQPYREFCCHNDELKFLLCSTPKEWRDKSLELVRNKSLRIHLGELCYQVVKEHYSMERKKDEWANVYRSVAQMVN